jgi:group I intron endonuclease
MKGVIYCYHCIPTGKKYIGQTKRTLHKRHISHKKDCKSGMDIKFYRAVRKYGWENFIVGIITECEFNDLDDREIFFIEKYDTYSNGYNSTLGGSGNLGVSPSQETRDKISHSNKGKKIGEEQKKYLSELYKSRGYKPPSRKGCKMTESAKVKISNASKNRKLSESSKLKVAEANSKEFILVSPEGKIIKGKNIAKFCRKNELSRTCIVNVLNSKAKHHKGWKKFQQ